MEKALISTLINYMTEKNMIADTCSPTSYSVTSSIIDFTASGGGLPTSLAINKPYYFQPNNTLDHQNSDIKALEVVSTLFESTFDNGVNNVASDDIFSRIMLYIVDGYDNILIQTPLSATLGISYGGYARKLYMVELKDIIWQKCYIELLDTGLIIAGEGIKLNVYYDKKKVTI